MTMAMADRAVDRLPAIAPVPTRGVRADLARCRQLAAHGALGFLPDQDWHALMQWATIRIVPRRGVIFRQSNPCSALYLILEGHTKLSVTTGDGREVVLEIAGPGECVGEVAVVNQWPHEADATALSLCRLLAIDGRQFRRALEQRPDRLLAMMRLVSERLRRVTEHMVDTLALPSAERLAKVLLQLARLRLSAPRHGCGLPLRLSQSELGSMTGLTRESVNKYLGAWRDAGWVLLAGGSVTYVDTEALSDLLGNELNSEAQTRCQSAPKIAPRGERSVPAETRRRDNCMEFTEVQLADRR